MHKVAFRFWHMRQDLHWFPRGDEAKGVRPSATIYLKSNQETQNILSKRLLHHAEEPYISFGKPLNFNRVDGLHPFSPDIGALGGISDPKCLGKSRVPLCNGAFICAPWLQGCAVRLSVRL